MIRALYLDPPLAFARLGRSSTPCESFHWGPNDLRPRGTGKTTILPAETLLVAEDGTVSAAGPTEVSFKDASGFRPVCPFFELYGDWTEADGKQRSGPVTTEVLASFGFSPADLKWTVRVANLKACHLTGANGDRVGAEFELSGDSTARRSLSGSSPRSAERPLVPHGTEFPLGSVQLTLPNAAFPEFRLRFTPAAGWVYGPTDFGARSKTFVLSPERLILNPEAAWCRFTIPEGGDPRTNPAGLFARDEQGVSLGLLDDVCDGVIVCRLDGVAPACGRVVVGPPHFAPDRRPFTSLADGLTDRVKRMEVVEPAYAGKIELTSLEVRDILERVLETMGLMNLDLQNDRARRENASLAEEAGLDSAAAANKAFPRMEPVLGRPLPITELGRQHHRRFVSLEVLEDMLREQPQLLDRLIRVPMEQDRYYDQRMPALMRGSDRAPMHLTRRQYELLRAWVRRLREEVDGNS